MAKHGGCGSGIGRKCLGSLSSQLWGRQDGDQWAEIKGTIEHEQIKSRHAPSFRNILKLRKNGIMKSNHCLFPQFEVKRNHFTKFYEPTHSQWIWISIFDLSTMSDKIYISEMCLRIIDYKISHFRGNILRLDLRQVVTFSLTSPGWGYHILNLKKKTGRIGYNSYFGS